MNKKIIKHFLIPGALSLTLVFQTQSSYASKEKNDILPPGNIGQSVGNPQGGVEGSENNQQPSPVDGRQSGENPSDQKSPSQKPDEKEKNKTEVPYEDENYNKNYQNHPIEEEGTGKYKFEKGKELSQEEIDKEFAKYKENASQFVKVQEWIAKLKNINLLGLEKNESSRFYEIDMGDNAYFLSPKGFKIYKNIDRGILLAHDLANDKIYDLYHYYFEEKGYKLNYIIGAGSDKVYENPTKLYGSYVKKIDDGNGNISYEYYRGSEPSKEDLDKVKKVLKETPSALLEQLGEKNYNKIVERAYQAVLVNSYLLKNEKDMSKEDRKNIVDYVYRFGLNYKNEELGIKKTESNGYVDVSPMGYAQKNADGTYKYKYKVKLNSITSNDKYSATHFDIYAPIAAKNLKFKLTGVQEYKKNDDGTYTYDHKNVGVDLEIASTEDKVIRDLIEADNKTIPRPTEYIPNDKYIEESVWNNDEYKHRENTFSIPYYNDLKDKKSLKNKVVEFDKNVKFDNSTTSPYGDKAVID